MNQGGMEAALRSWRERRCPEALGELLKSQRDRAYAIALRIATVPTDAEDAVQDAFIKLLSRTTGFDDLEAFEVTVFRAIVQSALNAIQKRRRRGVHETAAAAQARGTAAPIEPEREEIRALLQVAVADLPDNERAPVVLCFYQGMSVAQTAATLETPRETVRARLARALDRLRRVLGRNGKDIGAASIVGLLWLDGGLQAPASLCSALDKALPGKACSQIPAAAAHLGAAQTAAVGASAVGGAGLLAPAGILAAVALGAAVFWLQPAHAPAAQRANPEAVASLSSSEKNLPVNPAATAVSGVALSDAPRSQPGSVEVQKEDDAVKAKLGAMLLMGGMMLPAVARAGDADSIAAQIAARRDAKAAAVAAAPVNSLGRAQVWQNAPSGFGPGANSGNTRAHGGGAGVGGPQIMPNAKNP